MPKVVCLKNLCCCLSLPLQCTSLLLLLCTQAEEWNGEFCSARQSSSVETLTAFSQQCTEQSSIRLVTLRQSEGVSGQKTGKGKGTVGEEVLQGRKCGRRGQSWRGKHLWLFPGFRKIVLITTSRKILSKEWNFRFRKKNEQSMITTQGKSSF